MMQTTAALTSTDPWEPHEDTHFQLERLVHHQNDQPDYRIFVEPNYFALGIQKQAIFIAF